MKSLLLIIFSCITFFVFSQEENLIDSKGKKQGLWKKYHPNGMLRYTGNFKDDKPIGVFKYYYESGKFQVKISHFGSEAYANTYYETGEVKATGKYENQKKDSIWTFYDKDGYKMAEEFYMSGKREGTWKVFFRTGQIAEEKEYSNDFENGSWNQYFINGKPKLTATYLNGELEGRSTYYGSNGLKAVSGKFIRGARNGFWTFYEQDGKTVRKKEEYKNGNRIDANKDDDVIDPREIEYKSEDVLNPDNYMSPR
jgi:antitoxin component YwqK of YwqJK toxin-antitoxin module